MTDHSEHGPWYHKNIASQPTFSGESDKGSPLLTLTVGVAVGALGMAVYNNREMLKRHILAPRHGADRDTIPEGRLAPPGEFRLPTKAEIDAAWKRTR